MNILLISNKTPYPLKDGGAIAINALAMGLIENGHSVHILAINTHKHHINASEIPNIQNLKISLVEKDTSINIFVGIANFLFSRKPYNAERFKSNEILKNLEQILTSEQFDVIQFEGPYLWYCFDLVKKRSKALIALRSHNIENEIWYRTAINEQNVIKKLYLRNLAKRIKRFENSILNQYDILLPITARDEKMFNSMGNQKPSLVVPVGTSEIVKEIEHVNCHNSAFYIGALDWIPNQEGLVWFIEKVWPLILKKNALSILHVAGRNCPKWLSVKVSARNVLYHGEIDDAKVFMQQSGIMIVPLFSGSGMRVKIIEGMALGKSIITTSIGAEGIDITDGENILIADTPEQFAYKLLLLLANKDLAERISANARNFVVNKYDNGKISENLAGFYLKNIHSK